MKGNRNETPDRNRSVGGGLVGRLRAVRRRRHRPRLAPTALVLGDIEDKARDFHRGLTGFFDFKDSFSLEADSPIRHMSKPLGWTLERYKAYLTELLSKHP